jgi:serine/threonine protein kinase
MGRHTAIEFRTAFGTYRSQAVLGEGGAGTVYSAVDDGGNPVAIKVLDPTKATRDRLKRFKLTETQMAQLDSARGVDFDRLFLTFMIQHHHGAISMAHPLGSTVVPPTGNLVAYALADRHTS